jgi:hypothetical protein
MFTCFTQLAAVTVAGTAVGLAALATAGVAAADNPGLTQRDSAFVDEVHAAGIDGSTADILQDAHVICEQMASGYTGRQILAAATQANHNLSVAHTRTFITDSVRTYCSQFSAQLTA